MRSFRLQRLIPDRWNQFAWDYGRYGTASNFISPNPIDVAYEEPFQSLIFKTGPDVYIDWGAMAPTTYSDASEKVIARMNAILEQKLDALGLPADINLVVHAWKCDHCSQELSHPNVLNHSCKCSNPLKKYGLTSVPRWQPNFSPLSSPHRERLLEMCGCGPQYTTRIDMRHMFLYFVCKICSDPSQRMMSLWRWQPACVSLPPVTELSWHLSEPVICPGAH